MDLKKKVQVWIFVQEDERIEAVLLLKTNEVRGSFWQPITGGVEAHETIEEAAFREAQEESGLEFTDPLLDLKQSFEFKSREKNVLEYGFGLRVGREAMQKGAVVLDPREHVEYDWVAVEEALKRVRYSSNADTLRKLLETIRRGK